MIFPLTGLFFWDVLRTNNGVGELEYVAYLPFRSGAEMPQKEE